MKAHLVLIALLILAARVATANTYLPPEPRNTQTLVFEKVDTDIAYAKIEYQSEQISISGTARSDTRHQTLQFQGTYETQQLLDPGIKLAFQTYSPNGEMLLLDGKRTNFQTKAQSRIARFNYTYSLNDLNLPPDLSEFFIKFNYVQEGEYWMDVRYPETELPTLHIKELNRGEIFKILFSYAPTLSPQASYSYTLQYYESEHPNKGPYKHHASIEGFDTELEKRVENPRYLIPPSPDDSKHLSLFPYKFEDLGDQKLRLGFVWEGVQWYPGELNNFKQTRVISAWIYCLFAAASTLVIAACFKLANCVTSLQAKILSYTATTALILIFTLEFLSAYLPTFALCLLWIIFAKTRIAERYHAYWTLLAFLLTCELFLSHILQIGSQTLHAQLYSLSIAAIAFAPLTLIKHPWLRSALSNLLFILVAAYYLTLAVYFQYFQDFPTFNVLTYASQGADVSDSIVSLIDARFSAFAYAALTFFLLLNLARPSRSLPKIFPQETSSIPNLDTKQLDQI